jgi:hypothetical protein
MQASDVAGGMAGGDEDGDREGLPAPENDAPVLVAVLNSLRDWQIAWEEGWYRVPLGQVPRRVAADYLAFYQTGVFGDEGHAVNYYAPIRAFHVARRTELLPEETDHPRAQHWYYRIEIGPLQRLDHPVRSRRLRRVSFIPTTLSRLLKAEEINDLWWRDDRQERLHRALREVGLQVACDYRVGKPPDHIWVDLAVFCRNGRIAVLVEDVADPQPELREGRVASYALAAAGWHVLWLSQNQVEHELAECVAAIAALVQRLGGQPGAPAMQKMP